MNLVAFLAVWGAIVSTIALTWTISRDLQNRSKLSIHAMIGRRIITDGGAQLWIRSGIKFPAKKDEGKDWIVLTLTNLRQRPIYLMGWAVERVNESPTTATVVTGGGLPKVLKEGERDFLFTEITVPMSEIKGMYVWDSTGKNWRISKKNLSNLRMQADMLNQKTKAGRAHNPENAERGCV